MDRRHLLADAAAVAAGGLAPRSGLARPFLGADPFALGVASSAPRPGAVVLRTRLAPDPSRADGGMDPVPVPLGFEPARDEGLTDVVARGTVPTGPALAHSARVTVDGPEYGRPRWYRLEAGGAAARGRTRTLPAPPRERVRFATASRGHRERGLFVAHDRMVEDGAGFVLHLGDYIYGAPRGDVRSHESPEPPATLAEHRVRHALRKTDPSLTFQAVTDNHDALKDMVGTPEALAQRAAAHQAWFEHMSMEGGCAPGAPLIHTHGALDLGHLLGLTILDTRRFRDDEDLCREQADPDCGFTIHRPARDPVLAEARSMPGARQEAWVADRMARAGTRFDAPASTVLLSPFAMERGGEACRCASSWDDYPANRRRVLAAMAETELSNPVVPSADVHSNWAVRRGRPRERTPGGGAAGDVDLLGLAPPLDGPMRETLGANPHVKHHDADGRGHLLHDVTPETWRCGMRVMDDVTREDAAVSTQASFVVEDGRPRARCAMPRRQHMPMAPMRRCGVVVPPMSAPWRRHERGASPGLRSTPPSSEPPGRPKGSSGRTSPIAGPAPPGKRPSKQGPGRAGRPSSEEGRGERQARRAGRAAARSWGRGPHRRDLQSPRRARDRRGRDALDQTLVDG